MTQTRRGSLAEAVANVVVGFAVSWAANMLILPVFGFAVRATQALGMGVMFTAVSLVRSYVLRRAFNAMRWGRG